MKITIGDYDPATRTVPAKFEAGDLVHDRAVNACLKDGAYDPVATKARVAEVARGVEVKMQLGVIAPPAPAEDPAPAGDDAPADPAPAGETAPAA